MYSWIDGSRVLTVILFFFWSDLTVTLSGSDLEAKSINSNAWLKKKYKD